MDKKYILTEETKTICGKFMPHTLHRIRAVKDFGNVKKGDLGGWIESEENLSQEGNCWVYDNAIVCYRANVSENAVIRFSACVFGEAKIRGNAKVRKGATVTGQAIVRGESVLSEYAHVGGNAVIDGSSFICGHAKILGDAYVTGCFPLITEIKGYAIINDCAYITNTNDVIVIGPIRSRNRFTTFYKTRMHDIWVSCGCFHGSLTDFEKEVKETHSGTDHETFYLETIKLVKVLFDLTGRMNDDVLFYRTETGIGVATSEYSDYIEDLGSFKTRVNLECQNTSQYMEYQLAILLEKERIQQHVEDTQTST